MSPSETLRAAATKLRETASKATPGPWQIGPEFGDMVTSPEPNWNGNPTVIASDLADGHPGFDWNNVAWVALMSPAVAEPLAAWLETCANDLADARHYIDEPNSCEHALAIARSILGRTS